MRKILIILAISLMLCGCRIQVPDYTFSTEYLEETDSPQSMEQLEKRPPREYTTYPVEHPADNVFGNIYYSASSKIVSYYDAELRRRVVLCSQPNCTHTNEDCTAYLGGSYKTSYQVVGDVAYALTQDNDKDGNRIQFAAKNMVTGERKVLWDMTPEKENRFIDYLEFAIVGDVAFIQFRQYDMESIESDGKFTWAYTNILWYTYEMNLVTGERKVLFSDEVPDYPYTILYGDRLALKAVTEDFLLVIDYESPAEDLLTEEEYFTKYPQGNFEVYVREHFQDYEYVSIDRKTGERKRICGNGQEAKLMDSCVYRDKNMSFVDGDMVCIYNGRTGEVTQCFEQKNIGFQNLLDGRVIYNVWTDEEGGTSEFYWYDLTTGEKQQFQKGVSLMIFSVTGETTDCFIGQMNGIEKRITKQDFYNENYDKAF